MALLAATIHGVPQSLTQDLLDGKDLALLGRRQQVSLDSSASGATTLVFQTNNPDFRGSTVVVAYVVCETNTGAAFPTNVSVGLGVTGYDFLGGGAVDLSLQPSGAIAFNQMTSAAAFPILVTYGPQVNFLVTNASSATTALLGTFSAYGWVVA